MRFETQLNRVLFDLRTKLHCLMPKQVSDIQTKIEQYLEGETPDDAIPTDYEPMRITTTGIAVINVNGAIVKRLGLPRAICEFIGLCDLDYLSADLREADGDATITAIVLNVNSPGGFLSGVQSTAALVADISTRKQVVVYSDILNASAAYWISSQANSIISSVDAELGSIGVYLTHMSYKKAIEDAGIKVTIIKSGRNKALGNPYEDLSDDAKAILQKEVETTHALFKSVVTSKRAIADDDMEGDTYSGDALYDKGFVDGFAPSLDALLTSMVEENN